MNEMKSATSTDTRAQKTPLPFKCSICNRRFLSPEAGSAHLDKRHDGHGYLSWFNAAHVMAGGRP